MFIVIFALANIFESSVNEVGRFYWNIGDVSWPSLRDFMRSLSFALSIFISILVNNEPISVLALLIQMFINISLIFHEIRKNSISISKGQALSFRGLMLYMFRMRNAIRSSISHIFHMQTLNSFPLLERVFLKFTSGYDVVAGYSFLLSAIQTIAGLSTISSVANFRRKVLEKSGITSSKSGSFQRVMISFLSEVSLITIFVSIVFWVASVFLSGLFPKLDFIHHYNVPYISIIAISAVFCSGSAVVFYVKRKSIGIIILSILTMVFYLAAVILYTKSATLNYDPLLVIAIVSLLNIGGRFFYERDS